MWPPHSVNTWLTPACARTRATRSPPLSSAMASPSPEFLPLHGLAIEALRHQRVADAVDRLAPAGDVGHEALHARRQPVDRRRRRFRDDRMIREARVAARERAKLFVVDEPAGVTRPVRERRRSAKARRVEPGHDRAYRHDADLLGDEERTTRIPPRVHEATEPPLEAHPVAGRQATEPRGARYTGSPVGAQREVPRLERRRGDRVRADRLRAQRDRDPLPGGELELRRGL